MPKPKRENEEAVEKAKMSDVMIQKCADKIAKYGFDFEEYVNFLISVKAMNNRGNVLMYKNDQIQKYRELFIKDTEENIGDTFQFDKFKIKSCDQNGDQYETGYFSPRSFWDKIVFESMKK